MSAESKAYRLYDPKTKKIVVCRDVLFDEEGKWDWKLGKEEKEELIVEEEESVRPMDKDEEVETEENPQNEDESHDEEGSEETDPHEDEASAFEIRQSRIKKAHGWLKDYHTNFAEDDVMIMMGIIEDPTSYEEAAKEEKWVKAMKVEIEAIKKK